MPRDIQTLLSLFFLSFFLYSYSRMCVSTKVSPLSRSVLQRRKKWQICRVPRENRVEISQLGRARTCQIRSTRLAGSSTTRTEMRNCWEDPEATASSPIPIAPSHCSKRSRRSRSPRGMRFDGIDFVELWSGPPSHPRRSIRTVDNRVDKLVDDPLNFFCYKRVYFEKVDTFRI